MPPLPTRSTLTTVGVLATLALSVGIPSPTVRVPMRRLS